ncbi:energy transducer TonB [Flavobacterium reichenbachii]|uniref:energy transducer TonB n=1 Tax=Flavobacterium reichenbachii TaxID=362418 RepID=UPI00068E66DB|nr:energy transducer TonB [Flavobacterium reichenbachii]OXB13384.1 hypothetical protein B0A68_16685 [Flavobacterium reichenbachii]
MLFKINSGFKITIVPILVLLLLFSSKSFSQETKILETYYAKTTFNIKDEKGDITGEKRFDALTIKEIKTLQNIFYKDIDEVRKSVLHSNKGIDKKIDEKINEKIAKKIKDGGPNVVEIDVYKIRKGFDAVNGVYPAGNLTVKPTYPGGMEEFYKFAGHFFKVPKTPDGVLLKGKIYVTFVVEEDGSLTGFRVLRDLGYGTGEEALRILRMSQKWIPGEIHGEIVAAQYTLPISIQDAK